jgi:hypothetical protein
MRRRRRASFAGVAGRPLFLALVVFLAFLTAMDDTDS